ncbi:hypothetical protein RMS29_001800 [Agrobacterium rosae]|uniref:Uncharacterized protein n=1 Tax=Agrobacterium rosae TaxID=1972867 RepID=A0ABU4VYK4_9HYPH|nr:hypothetical protein [Agrobacterium rosae]
MIKPYADRVEILSDGASYTTEGILLYTSYKVHLCEDIPLAIVGSGPVVATDQIAALIRDASGKTCSVDETLELLSKSLAAIAVSPNRDCGFRIGIAAISESGGPISAFFNSFDDGDIAAFTLKLMPTGFGQGYMPKHEALMGNMANLKGTKDGLSSDGPWLFEQMRREKNGNPAFPEREPIYNVGGHLDLTIVRQETYQHERLLTWPDVIGEPIDPFRTDSALRASAA